MLANLLVTSSADNTIPNDGFLTLREAINAANQDEISDTITFASGISAINLTQGQLSITNTLTINGGTTGITIHAAANSRIFNISGIFPNTLDVTLTNLTLTGGNVNAEGGAIRSYSADLTLQNCTITSNTTADRGGGIYFDGYAAELRLVSSVVSGNTSGASGGGIFAHVSGGLVEIDASSIDAREICAIVALAA